MYYLFLFSLSVLLKIFVYTHCIILTGTGTVTVKIPNAAPFNYPETEADTWPVIVMLKYLTMVIELPQYENDFLRCELSGSEFLALVSVMVN